MFIQNRGVILYISSLIVAVMLAMGLGLGAIFTGQVKTIKDAGDSVVAFYAADSGIERELFTLSPAGANYSGALDNGASYNVSVLASGQGACPAGLTICIKSVGNYQKTHRAILLSR